MSGRAALSASPSLGSASAARAERGRSAESADSVTLGAAAERTATRRKRESVGLTVRSGPSGESFACTCGSAVGASTLARESVCAARRSAGESGRATRSTITRSARTLHAQSPRTAPKISSNQCSLARFAVFSLPSLRCESSPCTVPESSTHNVLVIRHTHRERIITIKSEKIFSARRKTNKFRSESNERTARKGERCSEMGNRRSEGRKTLRPAAASGFHS